MVPWLPGNGRLLFFYDIAHQPWGFDPQDRGGWAVICTESAPVEVGNDVAALPRIPVSFERFDSLPSREGLGSLGVEISDAETDAFCDGLEQMSLDQMSLDQMSKSRHEHRVSGFPDPIQGDDMEMERQLASNGIYPGGPQAYGSAKANALAAGAKDWLLLQLSSDDDLDVMWGESGLLYFRVREQDAARGDFSNVWLMLQCA